MIRVEAEVDRQMETLRCRLDELAAEHRVEPPAEADLTLDGLLEFLIGLKVDPAGWLVDVFSDRLSLQDLAAALDGQLDAVSEDGSKAIAALILADPRYSADAARLGAMAATAGMRWLEDGLATYQAGRLDLTPPDGEQSPGRIARRLESLSLTLGEIGPSLRKVFELLPHRAATSDGIRAAEALDQAARDLVATVEEVTSAMKTSAAAKEEGTG